MNAKSPNSAALVGIALFGTEAMRQTRGVRPPAVVMIAISAALIAVTAATSGHWIAAGAIVAAFAIIRLISWYLHFRTVHAVSRQ
ncbi:MAG TPA: hypothetical protein VEZ14_00160 [Dehalococcoidia bacterium]|nr:hypothetical protein [Dehalococcoidia bacterium]